MCTIYSQLWELQLPRQAQLRWEGMLSSRRNPSCLKCFWFGSEQQRASIQHTFRIHTNSTRKNTEMFVFVTFFLFCGPTRDTEATLQPSCRMRALPYVMAAVLTVRDATGSCHWNEQQHKTVCGSGPPATAPALSGDSGGGSSGNGGGSHVASSSSHAAAHAAAHGPRHAASVLNFAHNRFDYRKERPTPEQEAKAGAVRDAAVLGAVCRGLADHLVGARLCGERARKLLLRVAEQCETRAAAAATAAVMAAGKLGAGVAAGEALRSELDELIRSSPEYGRARAKNCDALGAGSGAGVSGSAGWIAKIWGGGGKPGGGGSGKGAAPRVVVVTAFDTSHAAVAQRAALPSVRCARVPVIVYDLGLSPPVKAVLVAEFGASSGFQWRTFDFGRYPPHLRLGREHTRDGAGEYAWKVAVIAEVAAERPGGKVLWTDGGNWIDPALLATPDRVGSVGGAWGEGKVGC